VRFSCSALHFTHVVCKNQPNKLFEVMVSMRDVSQRRVDIPHVYEYTYDISLTMPEDMPGTMWFCSGSLKP
jgi:hypothetical protein